MTINYHGEETLRSEAFETICNKKLSKLEKFAEELTVDVFMSMEAKNYVLKMVATTPKWEVISKEQSDDMYKNIDLCVDVLKQQITDKKTEKQGKTFKNITE